MNMNQMGESPNRGNSGAPLQNAVEHATFIENQKVRLEGWATRQAKIQEEVLRLNAELRAGIERTAEKEDSGTLQLGIDLRAATKTEIRKLRDEHSDLSKNILENGGEPIELIREEDEDSLDFTQ